MTLIPSNVKSDIIIKLNDIINIEEPEWVNLELNLKIKILHNLCNFLKNNTTLDKNKNLNSNAIINSLNIPLKNQRPKKIIEFCGMNKKLNTKLFDEFRKELILVNKEFRKTYNSKNKNYCFANLSNYNYETIIKNYNYKVFNFLDRNIDKIDATKLYNNLIVGNQQKIITNKNDDNTKDLKIFKINLIDEFLNIEFNNNVLIKFELYLTSEKITNNIPAKYKIFLTNIF
jgi:hypothetical protein